MRVSVPVSYSVKGIKFKHRDPSQVTMVENLSVDIPEVPADLLDVALVIRDAHGQVIETVYGHAGTTWIRNDRVDGEPSMVSQHRALAGVKVYHPPHATMQGRQKEDAKASEMLGDLGLLAMATARLPLRGLRDIRYDDGSGRQFLESTPESERMRGVTESDRDERMADARRSAAEDMIAVQGVLYRRVSEPSVVVDGRLDRAEVTWQFGYPNLFGRDPGGLSEYRHCVSVRDFGRLEEWFGDTAAPDQIDFSLDVVDERYFVRRCNRIALLADANRIIERGVDRGKSTEYVVRWCALRDHYDDMTGGEAGQGVNAAVARRDDVDFDRLCELCEGTEELSGPNFNKRAIGMWNSRSVELPGFAVASVHLTPGS